MDYNVTLKEFVVGDDSYITHDELNNLAQLSKIVRDDTHKNPCD